MKSSIKYEVAVQKIYDRIDDHRNSNADWLWQDSTDDQSVLRNLLRIQGFWLLERDRKTLFEKAVCERAYYDMLRFALAEKIHLGLSLEADEAEWVAKELSGEHNIPRYSSRPYTAHKSVRKLGLHALVVTCVHSLRVRGLDHRLACDAVAEACGRHNLDIRSPSTVGDIWKKNMPVAYRRRPTHKGP